MANSEDINSVINRIVTGEYTDVDIAALRGMLSSGDNQTKLQLGKYNVNIPEGKEVHIGDRIYQGADAETLRKFLQEVLQQQNYNPLTQLTGADGLGELSSTVPQLPLKFLSRPDEINSLKTLILSDSNQRLGVIGAFRATGVQGMGGIGKSVVIAELVRDEEVRRRFCNGIVWVTLGQKPTLPDCQALIAIALTGEQRQFKDVQEGKIFLSTLLKNKACLVIIDDVWDLNDAEAFTSLGQTSYLLITTRNAEIIEKLGFQEYRLGLLSDRQALQLLAQSSEQAVETLPSETKQVVDECGNLPLALAIVGAMAKGKPNLWESLLKRLQNADLEKIKQQFPEYPYPNLLRAIQVSVDDLEPEVKERYLNFAIFLEDTPIPVKVLQTFWESQGLDELDVDEIITTLVNKSLAQQDQLGRLVVHDLQLDYVRKQINNLSKLHHKILQAYQAKCTDGWATGPKDGYYFEKIGYHFYYAGFQEEFRDLLLNFQWLQAKLEATNIYALIADFNYFSDDTKLQLIKKAFELSTHILDQEPKQLRTQLQGRLMNINSVEKHNFFEQKFAYPHFLTITPSLVQVNTFLLRIMAGHFDNVKALAVSHNGKHILSGSSDKNMKLWDLQTGKQIHTFEGHEGTIHTVLFISEEQAVSASEDGTLKLWNLKSYECLHTFEGHNCPIYAAAFIRERMQVISGGADGRLKIWDLQNRRCIFNLQAHKNSINDIAVSSEVMSVISASSDKTLKLWNLESGKLIGRFKGHSDQVYSVAILNQKKQIISTSADKTIRLWNLQNYKCIHIFEGHKGSVYSVVPNAKQTEFISCSSDKTLKLWNLENNNYQMTIKDNDWSNTVAFTPNDNNLITASDDYTLKIWSLKDKESQVEKKSHNSSVTALEISFDGKYVLSSSEDGTVKFWNIDDGQCILELIGHNDIVTAVDLNKDGKRAISASLNRELILWDLSKTNNNKYILPITQSIPITAISFVPASKDLVLIASDNILWLLNINNFELNLFPNIHNSIIKALKVTEDGKNAITVGHDGQLILWNIETETGELIAKTEDSLVTALDITPDGKWGITGGNTSSLQIWDLQKREVKNTLLGHRDWIYDVAITPNCEQAVSVSHDKTLKLWDLRSNEMIACFYGESVMQACVMTSDAKKVVTGEQSGRLHFLAFSGEYV
ncbi:MAG: NB-ARC domain-containing protein [Nostocales cyanobacterium 94392]|nr:NB-ARC domain-containing protein [Nostocales cyanobacterium 94392]